MQVVLKISITVIEQSVAIINEVEHNSLRAS